MVVRGRGTRTRHGDLGHSFGRSHHVPPWDMMGVDGLTRKGVLVSVYAGNGTDSTMHRETCGRDGEACPTGEHGITVKWHVGSNDYGYSPNTAPSCHDDPAYARDALAADIARFAEYVGEQCGHTLSTQDCADCVRWDAARAVVDTLSGDFDMGEGVRFELYDGRPLPVVFWAWPINMDHAENRCNQD